MNAVFWGGVLRFGEAALACAPTLLVGLFVAGVFRKLLGPAMTYRLFGSNSWRSLPQAWLLGMLLPVCSLGVIPVAVELRRSGVKGGTILAFALTAPLFNPLSLLYGLTLSAPIVIFSFAMGSLLVVTSVGMLWDRIFPDTEIDEPAPPPVPPGLKRMAAVLVVGARHLAGPTLLYVAIGLAGTLVLSVIFPAGSLTDSMAHTDPWAPMQMLCVALPAYATPLNVMMQVGGMFVHGNSVGAAYVLLSLGTGANLGLLFWAWKTYGFKPAVLFVSIFILVVMAIAYALESPLYSAGHVEHPHTHAFDVYACPFPVGMMGNLPGRVVQKLREEAKLFEVVGLVGVGVLLALGIALRWLDPKQRIDDYLAKAPKSDETAKSSVLDVVIPAPVLGGIAILGLIILSVVGCYVYYPHPEEALEGMKYARVEALSLASSKDVEKAVKAIELYDDLTRKLQVGYYLRHGKVSDFQRAKSSALQGRLEQLKDVLQSGQFERTGFFVNKITEAHRRVREAYIVEASVQIPVK